MKSQKTHFKLNRRSYCGADRGENAATQVELTPNIEEVTCRSCLALAKKGQAAEGKKPKGKKKR